MTFHWIVAPALLAALPVFGLAIAQPVPLTPAATGVNAAKLPDLRWQKVPGFADGRERALVYGDPAAGGTWVYRVRVPRPIRVDAHTHSVDEHITILEGNWSLGIGRRFDPTTLVEYPAGSFVRIPAGTPHFVATGQQTVVIQSSGSGVFDTRPVN